MKKMLIFFLLVAIPAPAGAGVPEGRTAYRAGQYATAIDALQAPARAGDAEAQFLLGSSYAQAKPPVRNLALAEAWLLKSADRQYGQAFNALGNFYMFLEPGRDARKALPWYRKGADRGHPESQFLYGMLLFDGKEIARDRTEAYKWMALAARHGSHLARHTMARLLKDFTEQQQREGTRRADAWKAAPAPARR